jgi:hypothetical protein
MGSGIKIVNLLSRHPLHEFSKEVLNVLEDSDSMILDEIARISEVIDDPDCLNLCIGDAGTIGIVKHNLESRQKTSDSMLGEKNSMYGKKHSTDTLNKMSEAKRGKVALFKEGKMIKVLLDELPILIKDGWVPSHNQFKKYLNVCSTLTKESCKQEVQKWKLSKDRVAKSRVNRTQRT